MGHASNTPKKRTAKVFIVRTFSSRQLDLILYLLHFIIFVDLWSFCLSNEFIQFDCIAKVFSWLIWCGNCVCGCLANTKKYYTSTKWYAHVTLLSVDFWRLGSCNPSELGASCCYWRVLIGERWQRHFGATLDCRSRMRVILTCGSNQPHKLSGKSSATPARTDKKWFLKL